MDDLQQIADAALTREEAKDAPADQPNDNAPKGDPPAVNDKPISDEPEKRDNEPDAPKEEDEGYTADDLEDEPEEEKKPAEQKEITGLPPREQYIYDKLPTLTVKGKDGEVYNVKIAQELPDDFEFANKRDEAIFNQSLSSQERAANDLKSEFEQQDNENRMGEFTRQQQIDTQRDIGKLQADGILPKFKVPPTDPTFNDDPAAQEVTKILEYQQGINDGYARDAQGNSNSFYRLSFEHAAKLYYAQNPKADPVPRGDEERKSASAKVATGQQGDANKNERPRFKPGTDVRSITDYWMDKL